MASSVSMSKSPAITKSTDLQALKTSGRRGSYPHDLLPGDIVVRRDVRGRVKFRVSHMGSSGSYVQVYARKIGGGGGGQIVTFDRSQLRLVEEPSSAPSHA